MVKPASGGSALGAQKVSRVGGAAGRDGQLLRLRRHRPGRAVRRRASSWRSRSSTWGRARSRCPRSRSRPESGVFDYAARYTPGHDRVPLPGPALRRGRGARAADLAVRVHQALGLRRPVAHRRDRRRGRRRSHFLEVNVSPGLTETSMFPMAVEAAGSSSARCSPGCSRAGRGRTGSSRAACDYVRDESPAGSGVCSRLGRPPGDLRRHHADDPLQVVDRSELDDDASLGPADLDLHLRLEHVRQPAGRGPRRPAPRSCGCAAGPAGSSAAAIATASSVARTDRPSATIRVASASCSSASAGRAARGRDRRTARRPPPASAPSPAASSAGWCW